MTNANTHINDITKFPKTSARIEVKTAGTGDIPNGSTIINDKLTGDLKIEDYPDLTEIHIEDQELKEIIIINCPKLKKINIGRNKITKLDITKINVDASDNPVATTHLKEIKIGGNSDLEEISLEYCPELEIFVASGSAKLDKICGLDKLKKLKTILIDAGIIHLIHKKKLQHLEKIKRVAKELAGLGPNDKLDTTNLTDLKNQIMAGVNGSQIPQLKSDKENAENERDAAQANYNTAKTE
ncbi:MAG: hypothetical protein I3273_03755, partial [Candidatus Moeniiplasma glomeromycotorum]|nr:hypothetical protein [Candidatus Moeniiplasma glomeromycotorum]MCE8169211.1 hypothetical protein [Candidatus Moeniiplasma glomeromycotorum]